tara:strand:- start:1435 stop:2391 length:957 start_codon:yes stop_codon:yes gene_type:complete
MIRYGQCGDAVRELQTLLNAAGASLRPDGAYGPLTNGAVAAWKERSGLAPDGSFVSPTELQILREAAKPQPIPWTIPIGDWSGHQGDENYAQLAEAGDRGAIVKLTEGRFYRSADAKVQLPAARQHMEIVDAYQFPGTRGRRAGKGRRPRTFGTPAEEAQICFAYAQQIGTCIDRFWLDGEAGQQEWSPVRERSVPVTTRAAHNWNARWWIAWLEEMDRLHDGLPTGLYTSAPHIWAYIRRADKGLLAELARRPLWFANYPGPNRAFAPFKNPQPWTFDDIDIWQYDGDAAVDGYDGPVDRNLMTQEFFNSYPVRRAA